ncbi:MAG: FCD domain-containing protein [Gemmatimonadota bacterium]
MRRAGSRSRATHPRCPRRAAATADWAAYAEADLRFHNAIVASAGSRRLTELHLASMRLLRLEFTSVDISRSETGPAGRHVAEHRRIADLLAAGDVEEAAWLLTSHLEDARDALA